MVYFPLHVKKNSDRDGNTSAPVIEKISSTKLQITNNIQIRNSNDSHLTNRYLILNCIFSDKRIDFSLPQQVWNFGHWILRFVWDLDFVICHFYSGGSSSYFCKLRWSIL
jgi:hypothetical protein